MTRAALAVALLASSACGRGHHASCDDRGGVWVSPRGERWMIVGGGAGYDIYPLFPDVPVEPGLEVAPRVIGISDRGVAEGGTVRRRYMRGRDICEATAPAHWPRCGPDGLELVLGDPAPPLGFAPCVWGAQAPTRVERWRPE